MFCYKNRRINFIEISENKVSKIKSIVAERG